MSSVRRKRRFGDSRTVPLLQGVTRGESFRALRALAFPFIKQEAQLLRLSIM